MAGIYIHIPFCKQACHYCDFHFSTSFKYKDDLIKAILTEIEVQQNYLGEEPIETIYFGGGTPSLLTADEIKYITAQINKFFIVKTDAEITLEANPDDLSVQKLRELKNTTINRFSIGVQSFYEEDLKWMNRAHQASEAEYAIKATQDLGFENLTIDLIYGYPLLSDTKWANNIKTALDLEVNHISCYGMTVEPKTALASFINKGQQAPMDEAQNAAQFIYLMDELGLNGFEHYEISNFAKPGHYSKHNTNYWKGINYLGLGPSAHSYNGSNRQWNVANNALYLSALAKKEIPFKIELLAEKDKVNEYLMISLRTMWGVNLQKLEKDYGSDLRKLILNKSLIFQDKEWLMINNETIILTKHGKLYADHIASELFIDENEL